MNFAQTPYSILMTIPFSVCLVWTVILVLEKKNAIAARQSLAVFSGVCTVLYFCHALNLIGYTARWVDVTWLTCSTASYPLFWLYVKNFTQPNPLTIKDRCVLLPAAILFIGSFFVDMDMIGKAVIFLNVLFVCFFSYKRLKAYDIQVKNYYSNIEN